MNISVITPGCHLIRQFFHVIEVIEINMHTTQEGYGNALEFWNSIWEPIVSMAISMGNFEDEASEPEPSNHSQKIIRKFVSSFH